MLQNGFELVTDFGKAHIFNYKTLFTPAEYEVWQAFLSAVEVI
jgi:hypothetical protein